MDPRPNRDRFSSSSTTKDPHIHESPTITPGNPEPISTAVNAPRRPTTKSTPSYKRDPDTSQKALIKKRFNQWRRLSRDPYQPPDESLQEEEEEEEELSSSPRRVRYPGSGWTHLFYDLAWTATFATLAENGEFDEPMDYVSYFAFFAAALWLWTSQTLYTVHFYTNDWFHLISIFLQLLIFGGLAATTKGYEITTYIAHLPGAGDLNPDISSLTGKEELERFAAERTALLSAQAMALAFALTRFIHLVQYIRAYAYGRWGTGASERKYVPWGRIILDLVHPHVYAIVAGLILSNTIFFAVVGIVFTRFGTTRVGASLKLGLWVLGFSLEVGSHLWYPLLCRVGFFRDPTAEDEKAAGNAQGNDAPNSKHKIANNGVGTNPLPLAGLMLGERLDTVTTIILGEGINKFAGTLTSILTAPGMKGIIAVNVVSTALIIWFIAYLYFEGPIVESNLDEGLRRLVWMVTYLPFLASIFLLLVGIKNQFILMSAISMANKTFNGFSNLLVRERFFENYSDSAFKSNTALKNFFFARSMIWSDEYDKLMAGANPQNGTEWREQVVAWVMRISLSLIVNSYKTFNGEDTPEGVQIRIDAYNNNSTIPNLDYANNIDPSQMEFYGILTELLNGSIEGARYLMIFAGGILICLGFQSIIHSSPRDRYQWGVISSRLLMGFILALLLLLNLGRYQEFYIAKSLKNQRARVFNWLESNWILPTIALAYGVLFIVELVLAYFAKRATLKAFEAKRSETQARAEAGTVIVPLSVGGAAVFEQVVPYLPSAPQPVSPSNIPEDK
ncbi:hypothetical protein B0J17DRAFT_768552 [Rhizoctonia solani]|nr:hypothetical protein B0J17DRAFT_768552 [Rhizoctonia solani]